MFASHCGYNRADAGTYKHHSEKPKAERAMEDYKKRSFSSMSGFLPSELQKSACALDLYFSGFQSILLCMLIYFGNSLVFKGSRTLSHQ